MAGSYYGKDGYFYPTLEEKRRADRNWDQQERQNKLLQEQNELMKQQQYEEQRKIDEAREKEIQEQENKKLQGMIDDFIKGCNETIYPLMEEAGIKDPVEYHKKLRELYSKKPEKQVVNLLDENSEQIITEDELQNYPYDLWDEIRNLNNLRKPKKSNFIISYIIFAIVFAVILGILTGEFVLSAIISTIISITALIIVLKPIKKTEKNTSNTIENQRKLAIQSINEKIEKYNNKVRKENEEWENKIKSFEKKRLENFNYKLEIALHQLSVMEGFLEKVLDYDKSKNSKMNFELQFNKYPSDFEQKREEFWKEKRMKKAKEDGTEIFEELEELTDKNNNLEDVTNEKTAVNVYLTYPGTDKIKVINVIRSITGFSLKDATNIVNTVPQLIKSNVTMNEAEKIKEKFNSVGATTEFK